MRDVELHYLARCLAKTNRSFTRVHRLLPEVGLGLVSPEERIRRKAMQINHLLPRLDVDEIFIEWDGYLGGLEPMSQCTKPWTFALDIQSTDRFLPRHLDLLERCVRLELPNQSDLVIDLDWLPRLRYLSSGGNSVEFLNISSGPLLDEVKWRNFQHHRPQLPRARKYSVREFSVDQISRQDVEQLEISCAIDIDLDRSPNLRSIQSRSHPFSATSKRRQRRLCLTVCDDKVSLSATLPIQSRLESNVINSHSQVVADHSESTPGYSMKHLRQLTTDPRRFVQLAPQLLLEATNLRILELDLSSWPDDAERFPEFLSALEKFSSWKWLSILLSGNAEPHPLLRRLLPIRSIVLQDRISSRLVRTEFQPSILVEEPPIGFQAWTTVKEILDTARSCPETCSGPSDECLIGPV